MPLSRHAVAKPSQCGLGQAGSEEWISGVTLGDESFFAALSSAFEVEQSCDPMAGVCGEAQGEGASLDCGRGARVVREFLVCRVLFEGEPNWR